MSAAESVKANVPLRVVIIEDVRDVREGLSMLINGTSRVPRRRRVPDVEEALKRTEQDGAHVILTDIGLPCMSGIDGIRLLRDRMAAVPIRALTSTTATIRCSGRCARRVGLPTRSCRFTPRPKPSPMRCASG